MGPAQSLSSLLGCSGAQMSAEAWQMHRALEAQAQRGQQAYCAQGLLNAGGSAPPPNPVLLLLEPGE